MTCVIGTFQITHDEIHYKKPISFSKNVLKLTYGNIELNKLSGGPEETFSSPINGGKVISPQSFSRNP